MTAQIRAAILYLCMDWAVRRERLGLGTEMSTTSGPRGWLMRMGCRPAEYSRLDVGLPKWVSGRLPLCGLHNNAGATWLLWWHY